MRFIATIKRMGFRKFIKSRIVTPTQIKKARKEYNLHPKLPFKEILFWTRYHEGKAIEGYDFW